MRLSHVLDFKKNPDLLITTHPDVSLRDAVRTLCEHRIGAMPVLDRASGDMVGILSEHDILQKWSELGMPVGGLTVGDIMTREVITGDPDDLVVDVLHLMSRKSIRHIPLVRDGKLVGIVAIGDVLRALYQEDETKIRALSEYLAGIYHRSDVF